MRCFSSIHEVSYDRFESVDEQSVSSSSKILTLGGFTSAEFDINSCVEKLRQVKVQAIAKTWCICSIWL